MKVVLVEAYVATGIEVPGPCLAMLLKSADGQFGIANAELDGGLKQAQKVPIGIKVPVTYDTTCLLTGLTVDGTYIVIIAQTDAEVLGLGEGN